jgi:hypothetical protein
MKRAARLAAMSILVIAGLGLAGVNTAAPSQAHVAGYATHGHGGCGACAHDRHENLRYLSGSTAARRAFSNSHNEIAAPNIP